MRFHAPCRVLVHGVKVNLRRVAAANPQMKAKGWKGLVAYIQGPRGTGICEYRLLKPDPTWNYESLRNRIRQGLKNARKSV